MKPWATILLILIGFCALILLAFAYGRRTVRLLKHALTVNKMEDDAAAEEARLNLRALRAGNRMNDLEGVVVAQESGLDAQARILAQHGVVMPGRVYQIPARGEGGQPQLVRVEPYEAEPTPENAAEGRGNSGG